MDPLLEYEMEDLEKAYSSMDLPRFWTTLEELRTTLEMEPDRWLDLLRLTDREYQRLKAGMLSPTLGCVEDLASQLELDPYSLVQGRLDLKSLAIQQKGSLAHLPEKYAIGAYSKRRTSIHILNYTEIHLGWKARSQLLRRFQLKEAVFANPDGQISIQFLRDLCAQLTAWGVPESVIFRMGRHSVLTNFESKLGQEYRKLRSPKELYEATFTELAPRFYDRNHQYRLLSVMNDVCRVESACNPEVSESLKTKAFGSNHVCLARAGTFSGIAGYLMLPFANVEEKACIHRGDPTCIYEIDYHRARYFKDICVQGKSAA